MRKMKYLNIGTNPMISVGFEKDILTECVKFYMRLKINKKRIIKNDKSANIKRN